MKKIAAFGLLCALALSLLLAGCASGNKYAPCCKRTSIFNTTSPSLEVYGNPDCVMSDGGDYGGCLGSSSGFGVENFSSGVAYCQPSHCGSRPITECNKLPGCAWKGGSSGSCQAGTCEDIIEEKACKDSLCNWNNNTFPLPPKCEDGARGAAYTPMPICVDDAPQRCINDRCTVMLCGYRTLKPAPPPSSQDWNNWSQNMPNPSKPPSINLKETSCTFKSMTQNTFNAVKNSRGNLWVNSFRFGVGQSFSDFEEARYFFPISDKFCSASPTPNSKDRYVVYRTASSTWCSEHAAMSYYQCSENFLNFSSIDTCKLWCKSEANCVSAGPATKYNCLESNFAYNDAESCHKECAIVKNPAMCTLSSAQFPFLDSVTQSFKLTDEGHLGYFRINTSYYDKALTQEYLPASARKDELAYFECDADSDCTSGFCSYDQHVRGRCMLANGSRVDCGCYKYDTGAGWALNCKDGLKKADGTNYTMWRSINQASGDVAGRAQASTYNPYWDGGSIAAVNQYGGTTSMFDQSEQGQHTNMGSYSDKVYRFYIDGGTGAQPTAGPAVKMFQNCEIPRSNRMALYRPYTSGTPGTWEYGFNSALDLTINATDNLGPKAQKMCLYTFRKDTPHGGCCFWNSEDPTHGYIAGITGTTADGCPSLPYPGQTANPRYGYYGAYWSDDENNFRAIYTSDGGAHWSNQGEAHWMWVYEININESSTQVGKCNLSSTALAPYIDVRNVGWCEGCTYSTLAKQTVAPSEWSAVGATDNTAAENYMYRQMPLYLQANVMPILDVQDTQTAKSADGYWYYDPGDYFGGDGGSQWITTWEGTYYPPVQRMCKVVNGAALYVVANDAMASDLSNSYGSAYNGNADPVIQAYPEIVNGYLNGHVSCSGDTCGLNGKAAAIWRTLTLKSSCENPPLAGMEINGFATQAEVLNQNSVNALIGNSTAPGRLFNFFYTDRDVPIGALGRTMRILKGTPDELPGKIDVLMQSWYPTCSQGGDSDDGTKYEISTRKNFSIALLSNFSKPSIIWKFHFPAGSQCNQTGFTEYLFKHKGELVDAGILGIVYDDWKSGDGKLSNAGSRSGTPFCAVQNYSRSVLGISTHTYGQKVYATNSSCICDKCSPNSYAMGTCNKAYTVGSHPPKASTDQLTCNDGTQCQMPVDENGYEPTDYWDYFCSQTCVNYTACTACTDPSLASTSAFCRVEAWTGVWKTNRPYSGINDQYWDILSALPAKDKCCIEKKVDNTTIKYTFVKKQSATQRSEFLQFPRRGDEGLDCGRTPDTSFLKYCDIEVPIDEKQIACWRVG